MPSSHRLATTAVATAALAVALAVAARPAAAQDQEIQEGDTAFEDNDLTKAAKKYDAAIRKAPSLVPAGVYGKRAAIFILQKPPRYDEGLAFIARAERQHPGAPEILEQKALVLWQLGRRKEAIAIADDVAKQRPSAFSVQRILGEYYYAKEPKRAMSAYEKYLASRPQELAKGDALPRLRLGISYLKVERYDAAEREFELVSKQFRKNSVAQVNADNGLCAAYAATRKWDRAITVCERIIENPRSIDRAGSAWYNLGRSYLENNQARKARQAGLEFVRVQRGNAKGYILVGDAYFLERQWEEALRYYQEAEKRAAGDPELALKMGKTYRRMDRPSDAITKLEAAAASDPSHLVLAIELGNAYLELGAKDPQQKADGKALTAVDRLLKDHPKDDDLLYVAARALYNERAYGEARARYAEALAVEPNDIRYRDGLVKTINRQAAELHGRGDLAGTQKLLSEAYGYDKTSQLTNQNLAVLALQQGACDRAQEHLGAVIRERKSELVANRLIARAYLCQSKPDPARALEHYERAAKQAVRARAANVLLAEIYTEWAPLLVKTNLEDAIDKLEQAIQFASRDANVLDATKRNLALALFRRGWQHMRANKEEAAIADFERATREPRLLQGTEPMAFEFSLALAYLEKGDTTSARRLFKELATKGPQSKYLKAPYDKIGNQFFGAYAEYRTSTVKARQQAAAEFARLLGSAKGKVAQKARELLASSWEFIAFGEFAAGNTAAATSALTNASKYVATPAGKRQIAHNRAVLLMAKNPKAAATALEEMGSSPPEALMNLGILHDRADKPREAYDAWVAARAKGVKSDRLDDWINNKKRIFGY
jgi:tetratricopeptide (TPR) repeat protein